MNTKHRASIPLTDLKPVNLNCFVECWGDSWTDIRTVVDMSREPVLILDKDLKVLAANDPFYRLFQVEQKDTTGRFVYHLGNGQWNIPALRTLLKDMLLKKTFFKGFEIEHEFPYIGHHSMILSGRLIHSKDKTVSVRFPSIIMLVMEDVSEIMTIAKTLSEHTNQLKKTLAAKTETLEMKIATLEQQVDLLRGGKKK